MWYLVVLVASFVCDLIPVLGPPAWAAMLFLTVKFDLNPWIVLAIGVPGSVAGRYVMSFFMPRFSHRFIRKQKQSDLKFLGKKMEQSLWRSWSFVLAYTLLPLSTTALFAAAGIAKVNPLHILPPFTVGKFASDAMMLFTGLYAARNPDEVLDLLTSWKAAVAAVLGLVVLGAFLFVNWQTLLRTRKLELNFHVWK